VPVFHHACLSWCRFEDKPTTKIAAGPGVEVRGRGFIIILFRLRRPLKGGLISLFILRLSGTLSVTVTLDSYFDLCLNATCFVFAHLRLLLLPLLCCVRYLQHLPIVFRRAYLICTECPRSRRDLLWVSSACLTLATKSHFGAHAHGEACVTAPYRPWSVSNTKATCLLSLGAWCPRLRRGLITAAPYRPQGV